MKLKDDKKLEAIALATYRQVAENGLHGLTLARVAREAGIATSTLYVYYPSKEALLDALYERAKTATFFRLVEHDDPAAPIKTRLRRIWSNMLDNRMKNQAELAFLEQYNNSAQMSAANRALVQRQARFFNDILETGQREEVLKELPLPFLTGAIVGLVRETAGLIGSGNFPDNETTRANAFLLCWDAIKA